MGFHFYPLGRSWLDSVNPQLNYTYTPQWMRFRAIEDQPSEFLQLHDCYYDDHHLDSSTITSRIYIDGCAQLGYFYRCVLRNTFTASQGSPSIIDIYYTREPVNELCPKIAWAEQPRRTTATEAFDELFTTEKYIRKSTSRWHRLSPTIISRGSLYREIDNHHLTTFYWFIRLWSCWGA